MLVSTEGPGVRIADGRELHKLGDEWDKERLEMAALTRGGRLRVTSMDERVL